MNKVKLLFEATFKVVRRIRVDRVIIVALLIYIPWHIAIRVAALWYAMDDWANGIVEREERSGGLYNSTPYILNDHPSFLGVNEYAPLPLAVGTLWTLIMFVGFLGFFHVLGFRFSKYHLFVDKPHAQVEEEPVALKPEELPGVHQYDPFTRTTNWDICEPIDGPCYKHPSHGVNGYHQNGHPQPTS